MARKESDGTGLLVGVAIFVIALIWSAAANGRADVVIGTLFIVGLLMAVAIRNGREGP